MVLQKMAAINIGSMDVLVGAGSTGIELQRSLDDALKLILRRENGMQGNLDKADKDRVYVDGREDFMINGGNDFYEMTTVLSLMQMEEQQFNDFLKKISWEDVIESDSNGVNRVHRDNMQVLSKIIRDRTIY